MTETETLSAAGWIARLGDVRELTAAEKAALTDFMRDSPVHVRELMQHAFIRDDLRSLRITQRQLDRWVSEARVALADAIPFPQQRDVSENQGPVGSESPPDELAHSGARWRLPIMSWQRSVAATALAAALAISGWLVHSRMGLYSTALGEQRTLTLSDGSVITLNTDSRMKVDFSGRARVIDLLEGEAFFRVAYDTDRPFLVSADNAVVRSIGTQFNVRMADRNTVVSLVDGVVNVSLQRSAVAARVPTKLRMEQNANGSASNDSAAIESADALPESLQVTLNKGEEARIERYESAADNAVAPISKIVAPAVLRAISWTHGRLEFESTPLVDVLSEFQRYQPLSVEFDNDSTRQIKLTGSFEWRDPESVLAYIATIPSMKVDKNGPRSYFIHRS